MTRQEIEEFMIEDDEDLNLLLKHLRALYYLIQKKPYRIVVTVSTEEVEQEFPEY